MDAPGLAALAAGQSGLFTRDQARDFGFSTYQIRRRIQAGHWRQVLGRVLTTAGRPTTAALLDRAAGLAVPGSVLAGPSAARLHGIPVRAGRPCLHVDPHHASHIPGVRWLRDPLAGSDLTVLDGHLVTTRARTVFDLLRTEAPTDAVELLDRALQQRWITLPELTTRVRAHAGRHDAPALVRMVRQASDGAHSAAERRAVGLLKAAGITGWSANAEIHDRGGRLIAVGDLVFRARRLVIEVDGRAYHVSPDQFQRDRERQNRLVAEGWTVLRFTWADLTNRPKQTIASIRGLL